MFDWLKQRKQRQQAEREQQERQARLSALGFQVRGPSSPGRQAAAQELGRTGEPAAVAALVAALGQPLAHVVYAKEGGGPHTGIETDYLVDALVALGPVAVEPLGAALAAPQEHVRLGAAQALGRIADGRAVEPLLALLADPAALPAPFLRAVVVALGQLGDARARPALAGLLTAGAGGRELLDPLLEALAKLQWQPADGIEQVVAMLARDDRAAAVALGETAVEPLVDLLRRGHPLRDEATAVLGALRDPRAEEPLLAALPAPTAVAALGALRSAAAAGPLVALLARGTGPVTEAERDLVTALVQIGMPSLTPLIAALEAGAADPDRLALLGRALSLLDWRPQTPAEGSAYFVAARDWKAAAQLGPAAVPRLLRTAHAALAAQPDAPLARDAAGVILKLGGAAVEPLMKVLADAADPARPLAAELLGHLGDARALRPLLGAFCREEDPAWPTVALALGNFNDPEVAEVLREALAEPGPEERAAVLTDALESTIGRRFTRLCARVYDRQTALVQEATAGWRQRAEDAGLSRADRLKYLEEWCARLQAAAGPEEVAGRRRR